MGRWFFTNRQLQVSLFILTCCFTSLTGASLTVEQRLQALEATNVEIKQILVAKNRRLEELETQVQQLKYIVATLQNERNVAKNQVATVNNQPKNAIFRTCRETHLADPSLASGLQWIDPDGQGVGDDPIQVHCDMVTGTTAVLHDSEQPTDVGHCADPGCYSKSISYSATMRQITALADLSSECHQSIRYDCNYAPFEINGVPYSWWNDRNGNPQYFWAGSNSSVHTCQCGIDHNCLESLMTCNCDSNLPILEFDSGVITNKNLLPATRLNFGRTLLETSSGVYILGRLECSGQVAVNGMPSSCADLWKIGHTLSGLYSVMGTQFVEALYCDFTKMSSEQEFQERIGYVEVKSLPVYFDVQRSTIFAAVNTPILFDFERLNIGGAWDKALGKFTAPRSGLYFFVFSGVVAHNLTSSAGDIAVDLKVNGNHMFWTRSSGIYNYESISLQSALNLKAGDQVWLEIGPSANSYLFDNDGHYHHFTGWLLQEEIATSL